MKPTLMALCFCLPLAGKGDAKAQTPAIHLKIEQLTSGSKHHFFGYIGQCQTIPWNASEFNSMSFSTPFREVSLF